MLEVNLSGVYLPAVLVWAGIAFLLSSVTFRAVSRMGFYALVWHRALFNVAVFVLFWGAISAVGYHMAFRSGGWAF
ncbi:MAG: DUF1656 domain-containing protein [Steroidobacteraceae bacterium]